MTATLHRRGPDGSGFWISPERRVGLGHRRLAIVDLSDAGRQPMANADGTIQVTFNGEIYNFPSLRDDLAKRGYSFRSRTDTEVLVYLYEEMGDKMVEFLDGDFGFGLWDDRLKRLLLARDQAGVKPVYYTEADGQFLFASEIKA
jgi:asparagine synthase (glutamine-hydrolysing)